MKMTKRLATLAACAVMAASSMVGMGGYAANTTLLNETESNNTIQTADSFTSNNVVSGVLSSSSDVDYFSYYAPATGYVNFELGLSGGNYNLTLLNSSGSTLATSNTGGVGVGESIRYYVNANTVYYIKVSSQSNTYGSSYKLYASYPYTTTNTWYPQIDAVAGSYERWNTYSLDDLTTKNNKKFMINGSTEDLMYEGCALACIAMVLNNQGAKTTYNITDYRTGYYGKAYADPFTVAMVNADLTSVTSSNSTSLAAYINNWGTIASAFGKTVNKSHTATWDTAVDLVSSYPNGVIVKFIKKDSSGSDVPHYVVLTKSSNSAGYVIYDPGTNGASGNGKTWENSYTKNNYTQSQVKQVITIS